MSNWYRKIFGGREKSDSAEFADTQVREAQSVAGDRKHAGGTVHRSNPEGFELPASPTGGDWAPGQEVLDDFVVEGTLGEGGMGKVYLLRSRSTTSRFAVKRVKGIREADRRNFLAELQTWIDLPEHANLVPCRFFRTMGNEILIFAEYVEGGSLQEWIDSRKLYEGGPRQALERMLDVAIQFAWGLSCLHELGLVHQDVKPGNVLMGTEGKTSLQGIKPRVTDYGLARARAAGGETASTDPRRSILVSTVGGSPVYWSPEQAAGWSLTRKTDIWSWGVSVLEMFTGGVTWESGLAADEVLEQYLRNGAHDKSIPAMPVHLPELLRECFRQEPSERLASLSEAVDRLKAIYQESVGTGYNRTLQGIERTVSPQAGIKEHRGLYGPAWRDPGEWLEDALIAAGRDPAKATAMLGQRGVSRRGELVAEVAAYDEAKQLYVRLVREGHKELECDLARLCMDKALVHSTAGDHQGASQECDQAIAIWARLVNTVGRRELADKLAMAYLYKANAVSNLGEKRGTVTLCDQGIAIWERLVNQEGRRELANGLATAYMNKALAVRALGDNHAAVVLCDQTIAIRERLVNQEGRRELANDLATAYLNKAVTVKASGDNRGAVALYDRTIMILERSVNREGCWELANDLAKAYLNKAAAVRALGDNHAAVVLSDQTIAIQERLVIQEGRRELANDLAMAYLNKANAVRSLGDNHAAVVLYDQTIAIRERLVNQEGHRELANDLATAYLNKAVTVRALGDNRGAVVLYEQAIAIRDRLVNQDGRRELAGDLAWTKAVRGEVLVTLGEQAKGIEEMRSAQRVLETEIARTGRADLKQVLTWLQQQLRGSAIATQSESLRTPQTRQDIRLMDVDFVVLDLDRGDIEAGDTSAVMAVLKQLLERDATTKFCERVDLRCSGYDSDSRELWEIPEVRAFVHILDQQFPYWCYFLSRNGEGLLWLTYCLYPLALSQDEKQRLWLPAIRKYIEDRGIPQMTAICRYVGCSDQEAVRLTNSAVNYLVNKPLGKYVADQGEQQGVSSNSERFSGAAERGDADAQYYLGSLYYAGHGAAEDPEDYFIPQDYGLAAMWFQKAADKGHAHAQFALGVLYDEGQGVAQHYAQAAAWFRKAAEQGDADAQFNLGRKYYNGQGMLQDCTQAVVWLRKAAEQGHAEAQFSLGERCFCGEGVPQDNSQAAAWFLKAARQGNADAQGYLGYLYDHGLGVMQDSAQAAAWLLKAAEQGNAYAQNSLGILYRDGQGVPQDYVQAAAWFRKAAALGHSEAVSNLSMLCANGRLPRR